MAYLGRQPIVGNYQVLDALTATTTDTYALTKNSVAVFPQTPANCIVSLNGVIQAPYDSYTISGSNIVFASALTASDSIDFITVLGDVLNVGTVSDGTIGISKLSATGTPSSSTFLRGDNSWVSAGGANTPYFEATRSTNQTITHDTDTKIVCDVETFDTAGDYDNATNYRFTPQTAGKYYIYANATAQSSSTQQLKRYTLSIRKNGSSYKFMSNYFTGNEAYLSNIYVGSIIDFNGSSDYVELWCKIEYASSGTLQINGSGSELTFGGYKIIE